MRYTRSYPEAVGSFPKVQIYRALLGNEFVESGGLFLRPASGEMIQIIIGDRRFLLCLTLRRFFQQLADRLIHAGLLLLGPLLNCTGDFGWKDTKRNRFHGAIPPCITGGSQRRTFYCTGRGSSN